METLNPEVYFAQLNFVWEYRTKENLTGWTHQLMLEDSYFSKTLSVESLF